MHSTHHCGITRSMHSILVKQDVAVRTRRLQAPATSNFKHLLIINSTTIMLGMLTSPPPIFPCRRATNVSARWDWIRVTLSKSRNNYYCLVSTASAVWWRRAHADGPLGRGHRGRIEQPNSVRCGTSFGIYRLRKED